MKSKRHEERQQSPTITFQLKFADPLKAAGRFFCGGNKKSGELIAPRLSRLLFVFDRILPVVVIRSMTTRRTAAAGFGPYKAGRHTPIAELGPLATHQLVSVGSMGLMTSPAGAAFILIGHMHKVEILLTVTKFGVNAGIRKAEQVLVMTFQAKLVAPLHIWLIETFWIAPLK